MVTTIVIPLILSKNLNLNANENISATTKRKNKKLTEVTANGNLTTKPPALTALDHNESPALRYSRFMEARRVVLRDQADVKMSGFVMLSTSWLLEELKWVK
jgi:hypothetical protein